MTATACSSRSESRSSEGVEVVPPSWPTTAAVGRSASDVIDGRRRPGWRRGRRSQSQSQRDSVVGVGSEGSGRPDRPLGPSRDLRPAEADSAGSGAIEAGAGSSDSPGGSAVVSRLPSRDRCRVDLRRPGRQVQRDLTRAAAGAGSSHVALATRCRCGECR